LSIKNEAVRLTKIYFIFMLSPVHLYISLIPYNKFSAYLRHYLLLVKRLRVLLVLALKTVVTVVESEKDTKIEERIVR
jgi:hypothetical protein